MAEFDLKDMEQRLRDLEDRVQGLLHAEHHLLREHQALQEEHDKLKADYNKTIDSWWKWEENHEGRHQEINDHLYAAFFKLFPEQENFWTEVDAIIAKQPREPAPARQEPPEEAFLHDAFCFCPDCTAKDAKRVAEKAEKHFAETGHPMSCQCPSCVEKRLKESRQKDREKLIRQGLDPEPTPPPKFNPNQNNPFANPPRMPPLTRESLPTPPRKTIPHEPYCICDECVRRRGTSKPK